MITSLLLHVTILMSAVQISRPQYDDYYIPDYGDTKWLAKNKVMMPDYGDVKGPEAKPLGYTCGLCFVVDEQFSKVYNVKEVPALKAFVQKFVDHVNWVFRNIDWDSDGRSDNIGFRTSKISYGWRPYKKETVKHYDAPKPAIELLKVFARLNFTKCCLGVGFTNRPLMYGLDGISFGASERLLGGICDHRNPHEDFMANMNVVLISGRGLNKSQLSTTQIAIALLHELGHAFGVNAHDNDYKDPQCWGFRVGEKPAHSSLPADGRYIMWAKSPQSKTPLTLKKNTLRFSTCSKTSIWQIVSKRKSMQKCFRLDYHPFCGNGIVEGMEMCDCGNEYECSKQKCCGSRKSEKPCVFNTKLCGTPKKPGDLESSCGRRQGSWIILINLIVAVNK